MNNSGTIAINYSNEKLRILVEEFITQQRNGFMLKDVCSYVLFWAMEDGRTNSKGLFESNQISHDDCARVKDVLEKIAGEGRIVATSDGYKKILN